MSDKFERESAYGWLIAVLHNNNSNLLDTELRKYGLTIALWPTLMCLWEEEGVTQKEISDKARVQRSTTTRTLDKLEALGLIERKADPNSRRVFKIFLTDKGRKLEEELLPIPLALTKKFLEPLSANEQEDLIRILQKLVKTIV